MDHSVSGGRDLTDNMTREELEAYHQAQIDEFDQAVAQWTPKQKELIERLGFLFERVALKGRK